MQSVHFFLPQLEMTHKLNSVHLRLLETQRTQLDLVNVEIRHLRSALAGLAEQFNDLPQSFQKCRLSYAHIPDLVDESSQPIS